MLSNVLRRAGLQTPKTKSWFTRAVFGGVGLASVVAGGVVYADECVHPQNYDFYHKGLLHEFPKQSLRRGFEVYRQVCSTCHSLEFVSFRHLVGVTHTEEHAKAIAQSSTIKDGPNDKGEMFERTGKLFDYLPNPYPNDEFARYVNGGALPPDLSVLVKARHSGDDYVFSLLTGYREPPAGVELRDGLYFNPYFPGGAIAMPPPLLMDAVEWEDDTFPSISQQAHDVTVFLNWCSEPETDVRKQTGLQLVTALVIAAGLAGHYKRFKWNIYKTRKITYLN